MSAWPGTLPQIPLTEGYMHSGPNNIIATEMDVGAAKARMRGTVAIESYSMSFAMDTTQIAAFWTFYKTTTHYGTDLWTFPLQPAGSQVSGRFRPGQPPQEIPRGIGATIAFVFEVIP